MAITTHEQGLEQGLEQGQRKLILQMLEERFGTVDEQTKNKLNEWSGDYSILVTRILKADSIEDVDLQQSEK